MGLHHNLTVGIRPTGLLAITHLEVFTLFLFYLFLLIHHFLPFLCNSQSYKLNLLHSYTLVIPSHSPSQPFISASFHVCLNHMSFSIPPSCSLFLPDPLSLSSFSSMCHLSLRLCSPPPCHPGGGSQAPLHASVLA